MPGAEAAPQVAVPAKKRKPTVASLKGSSFEEENDMRQFLKVCRPKWGNPIPAGGRFNEVSRVMRKLQDIGVTSLHELQERVSKNTINEDLFECGHSRFSKETLADFRREFVFIRSMEQTRPPYVRQLGPLAQEPRLLGHGTSLRRKRPADIARETAAMLEDKDDEANSLDERALGGRPQKEVTPQAPDPWSSRPASSSFVDRRHSRDCRGSPRGRCASATGLLEASPETLRLRRPQGCKILRLGINYIPVSTVPAAGWARLETDARCLLCCNAAAKSPGGSRASTTAPEQWERQQSTGSGSPGSVLKVLQPQNSSEWVVGRRREPAGRHPEPIAPAEEAHRSGAASKRQPQDEIWGFDESLRMLQEQRTLDDRARLLQAVGKLDFQAPSSIPKDLVQRSLGAWGPWEARRSDEREAAGASLRRHVASKIKARLIEEQSFDQANVMIVKQRVMNVRKELDRMSKTRRELMATMRAQVPGDSAHSESAPCLMSSR